MKKLILAIILLFSFSTQAQSSLNGLWDTGEDNTTIEVSEKNNQWVGLVKNSDTKEDIGILILKDLKKDGDKSTGKIYAPKRKKWYDVDIIVDKNNLNLKVNAGLFSKSLEWKRVQ
tara:strand:+ start:107 stop:454 length:348 start_codon:yes stop_codon:yes gene_type:complete